MKKVIKNSIQICYSIGIIQGISLAVYALWTFIAALVTGEIERLDTLIVESLLYLVLVISIIIVSINFKKVKRSAFTPFLLVQLFIVTISWPLLQSQNFARGIGIIYGALALIGTLLSLLPVNRKKFFSL